MSRGLLDIESISRQDIESILSRSKTFQPPAGQPFKRTTTLQGRSIVNLFFEASTRTRTSFEIAARRLGAEVLSITSSGSSVAKGESLVDTLNTLGAMRPDAVLTAAPDRALDEVAVDAGQAEIGEHAAESEFEVAHGVDEGAVEINDGRGDGVGQR